MQGQRITSNKQKAIASYSKARLIEEAHNAVKQFLQEENQSHGHSIVLFGDTGVGKSTTINSLIHEMGMVAPSSYIETTMNDDDDEFDFSGDEGDSYSKNKEKGFIGVIKFTKGYKVAPMGYSKAARKTTIPEFYPKYGTQPSLIEGYIRTHIYLNATQSLVDVAFNIPQIILAYHGYIPNYLAGYIDTPGFLDPINPFQTCILNNLLLQRHPRLKGMAFLYPYAKLDEARGGAFLDKFMHQIAQLFKPDEIYADKKTRELDINKLTFLFDSLFFVFTKVRDEGDRTSLIGRKYLLPFCKHYKQHQGVPNAKNYVTLLHLMPKKKNYFLIRPLDQGKSKKKLEKAFIMAPGIDRSSFSFIGSPQERGLLISLRQNSVQGALYHLPILMGGRDEVEKKTKEMTDAQEKAVYAQQEKLQKLISSTENDKELLQKERGYLQDELKELV